MKLDCSVNDVKWRNIEVRDDLVNRRFIPFEIYQEDEENRYCNINSDSIFNGNTKVKLIHFEVIEYSKSISNQRLPKRICDELRWNSMSNKMISFQGELFHNIYFEEGYTIFSKLQAFCNDPSVFIKNSGELGWTEIEAKEIPIDIPIVTPIVTPIVIKVKKTIFDFIDLT